MNSDLPTPGCQSQQDQAPRPPAIPGSRYQSTGRSTRCKGPESTNDCHGRHHAEYQSKRLGTKRGQPLPPYRMAEGGCHPAGRAGQVHRGDPVAGWKPQPTVRSQALLRWGKRGGNSQERPTDDHRQEAQPSGPARAFNWIMSRRIIDPSCCWLLIVLCQSHSGNGTAPSHLQQ